MLVHSTDRVIRSGATTIPILGNELMVSKTCYLNSTTPSTGGTTPKLGILTWCMEGGGDGLSLKYREFIKEI